MTPLYPITDDIIREQFRVLKDELMKWTMFGAQWKLDTKDFFGKPIKQEGILFSGSIRHYYWSNHFDPFIENAIRVCISKVLAVCKEKALEPEEYVKELEFVLKNRIEGFIHEMQTTDTRLVNMARVKGEQPINTQQKLDRLLLYLSNQAKAALFIGNPGPPEKEGEILQLKPGLYGVSLDLKSLFKRFFKRREKKAE